MNQRSIGVALSGGGHRATAFTLGALMYLADSRRNADVKVITSVSGGSITNAYLALLPKPWEQLDGGEFRSLARVFARQLAGRPGAHALALLLLVVGWISWLFVSPPFDRFVGEVWQPLAVGAGATLLSAAIGPRGRGTLFGWWGTWVYLGVVSATAASAFALLLRPVEWYWPAAAMGLVAILFGLRGVVAGRAFSATIRSGSKTAGAKLGLLHEGGVRHVFCATEAHSGRHCFLSKDFVYTPGFGVGIPGTLSVAKAVQASACLPGAFPFTTLRSRDFEFSRSLRSRIPRVLVLCDGGVYDNTGSSWYLEGSWTRFDLRRQLESDDIASDALIQGQAGEVRVDSRTERDLSRYLLETHDAARALHESLEPPDEVIVVNAAYPPAWSWAGWAALPLLNDLTTFPKSASIMYNKGNLQRFKELRRMSLGDMADVALVSIEENPVSLPTWLTAPAKWLGAEGESEDLGLQEGRSSGDPSDRAREMIAAGNRFYTSLAYPTDEATLGANRDRALKAMEHLFPGYLDATRTSDEEEARLDELEEEIERIQADLGRRDRALEQITDHEERRDARLARLRVEGELHSAQMDVRRLESEIVFRGARAEFEHAGVTLPLGLLRAHNRKIGTHLSPLGVRDTARLLYHGYLTAMINLHVLIGGYPLLKLPTEEDFVEFVSS